MIFRCDRSALTRAVLDAQRASSSKANVSILEGLLISAAEGVKITGYNLSFGICAQVEAEVEREGEIVLDARLFSDILKRLPDDEVILSAQDDLSAEIRCGTEVFNLMGKEAELFPDLPEACGGQHLYLDQLALQTMIDRTSFAISEDMTRPALTGCLFEAAGDTVTAATTDGCKMAVYHDDASEPAETPMKFLVPGFALRELRQIGKTGGETVEITLSDKHISFDFGGTVLVTRLIEQTFIDYNRHISAFANNGARWEAQIDAGEFADAVERAAVVDAKALAKPVTLTFGAGNLNIKCKAGAGKSSCECKITGKAQPLTIGFNHRHLLPALKACKGEKVCLSVKDALSPLIITPTEGDSFLYLLLPVRLDQ